MNDAPATICRDEEGRVLAAVFYTDDELRAMPITLRNEYLDAVAAHDERDIDRYVAARDNFEPPARWEP